eukprot:9669791-Alexandrium_andersonii.AAC.1
MAVDTDPLPARATEATAPVAASGGAAPATAPGAGPCRACTPPPERALNTDGRGGSLPGAPVGGGAASSTPPPR